MNIPALLILGLPLLCLAFIVLAAIVLASKSMGESNRKKEVWPKFAEMIGGALTEGAAGQRDTIAARLGEDPFYLDTYVYGANHAVLNCTRMRVFYRALNPIELVVCSREMQAEAQINPKLREMDGAAFGLTRDFAVFSAAIDQASLVLGAEQAQLVESAKPIDLRIRRRQNWKNQGVSNSIYEVHLQKYGVVTELPELMAMFHLISTCLRKLHEARLAGRMVDDTRTATDYFNTDGINAV